MFTCCSLIRSHMRNINDLKKLGLENKNQALIKCLDYVADLKLANEVKECFIHLAECVEGTHYHVDDLCNIKCLKEVYILTGNEDNSLFTHRHITRSATILLLAICVQLANLEIVINDYNNKIISTPIKFDNLDDKCLFINSILTFSSLRLTFNVDIFRGNVNKNYLSGYNLNNGRIILNNMESNDSPKHKRNNNPDTSTYNLSSISTFSNQQDSYTTTDFK